MKTKTVKKLKRIRQGAVSCPCPVCGNTSRVIRTTKIVHDQYDDDRLNAKIFDSDTPFYDEERRAEIERMLIPFKAVKDNGGVRRERVCLKNKSHKFNTVELDEVPLIWALQKLETSKAIIKGAIRKGTSKKKKLTQKSKPKGTRGIVPQHKKKKSPPVAPTLSEVDIALNELSETSA